MAGGRIPGHASEISIGVAGSARDLSNRPGSAPPPWAALAKSILADPPARTGDPGHVVETGPSIAATGRASCALELWNGRPETKASDRWSRDGMKVRRRSNTCLGNPLRLPHASQWRVLRAKLNVRLRVAQPAQAS